MLLTTPKKIHTEHDLEIRAILLKSTFFCNEHDPSAFETHDLSSTRRIPIERSFARRTILEEKVATQFALPVFFH